MNVDQEALNEMARAFQRIHTLNAEAQMQLRRRNPETAAEALEQSRSLAWLHMQAAIRAGADSPDTLPRNPPTLTELARMDTPANRRLLAALREATAAAVERDKETGHYPDGIAEGLGHITASIAEEVEGPAYLRDRD